ncbi:unnamed protein product [Cylicocyclus nassatus]|uniref:Peptidase A1 domain-containing protein n=1 Tax=Cylicocyclus nassatus TaxID=53992 RepID=A0AA36M9W3_CYLNA|nr:unnamed protein product [Cylicocyclus nassatus]
MLQSSITVIFFIISWRITGVVSTKEEEHVSFSNNGMKTSIVLVPGKQAYFHKIYVGSKQEKFNVAVSLRSSLLWIPSVTCKSAACASRNKFHPKESDTFVNISRSWSQQTYGTVSGVHGKDNVRIGSADERQLLVSCIFGMATVVSDDFGKNMAGCDGMLGLGVRNDSRIPSDPFLLQLDKSKTLDRTMFTVYMNQNSQNSNAGSVSYGGTDSGNCPTSPKYHLLLSNTFVRLKTISMGASFKIGQTTMMPELVHNIVGPKEDVDRLAKSVGAKLNNEYFYEIGCGANVPDFKFSIDNAEYTITSDKLIVKVPQSSTGCALAFKFHQVSGDPRWYFGAPLFMQYCVTFDYTGKSLGFADVKNSNTTTRPVTTLRPRKLAPVLHYAGILVSMLIALNLV